MRTTADGMSAVSSQTNAQVQSAARASGDASANAWRQPATIRVSAERYCDSGSRESSRTIPSSWSSGEDAVDAAVALADRDLPTAADC